MSILCQRDVLLAGRARVGRTIDEPVPLLPEESRIIDVGLPDAQPGRSLAEAVASHVIAVPADLGFLLGDGNQAFAHRDIRGRGALRHEIRISLTLR